LNGFFRNCLKPGARPERNLFASANYNRVHLFKSLIYFTDAEKDPPPDMLVPLRWEEVKSFFAKEVPPTL
jgi:hypothetical protein